jgi:hypothetical protein
MRPLVLALAALLLSSCSLLTPDPPVQIRVQNTSASDFEAVTVQSLGSPVSFGAVAAGEASLYQPFDVAFGVAHVEVQTASGTLSFDPGELVGEPPLPGGHYTYLIAIDPETGELILAMREEL